MARYIEPDHPHFCGISALVDAITEILGRRAGSEIHPAMWVLLQADGSQAKIQAMATCLDGPAMVPVITAWHAQE